MDLSNLGPDDGNSMSWLNIFVLVFILIFSIAFSSVPYMKGSTFLRYLEDLFGGPEIFEPFLRSYLEKFKYQSLVTQDFKQFLYEYFNKDHSNELEKIDWDAWLYSEGMPPVSIYLLIYTM